MRSRLAALLVCGAVLLQQGAGQRHDYRGDHQECHHGDHREGHQESHHRGDQEGHQGGHQRQYEADSRIHFNVDSKETYQAPDRSHGQRDPQPGNDMASGNGIPEITLDNRNFIFAPSFSTSAPCPPGAFRITKTSPCRYPVRDAAPRGPVRPEKGVCPRGMLRVGQWCREPYG